MNISDIFYFDRFHSFRLRSKWWDSSALYDDWSHLLSAWVRSLLILRNQVNRFLFSHCLFSSNTYSSSFFPFILINCKFVDQYRTFLFAFILIRAVYLLSLNAHTFWNLRLLIIFDFVILLEILNVILPQHSMVYIALILLICNLPYAHWLFSNFQVVIEPLLEGFI